MLSKEDSELLCRVGPGTPMGDLMRRYWLPFAISKELPSPDSDPVRSDAMIIRTRRRLIETARTLRDGGTVPPDAQEPVVTQEGLSREVRGGIPAV